ncbi:Pkinase-domain-containing protein [Ganoderma leucocontextum]|nr:Pkinase-domain-containing protein [Ganoderma leucocontextum]
MAVEEHQLTQSTQHSTQPTQDASQDRSIVNAEIWGSLIPYNSGNPYISRVDLLKTQRTYTIGRSRQNGVNDISFSKCLKMSHTHCTIEWDGEEATSSAIIVTDLGSSNGTFVNGQQVRNRRCKILRDWNIISFAPPKDRDNPKEDYRFIFRHRAAKESLTDSIHQFYDFDHGLGSGAFATVVKALHLEERKWYAIKSFPGERVQQFLSRPSRRLEMMESAAKHLEREVTVLKRLRHRNICQLKEAFVEPGYSISIVLEYVSGGDLNTYVNKRDIVFEIEAQGITYQICEALVYIHSMGVVHRDLKPENVLLTEDKPPVVKVADFGLAKVMDSLSIMQTKCGTPAYVAPEVLDQDPDGYDYVVDSWSLGVLVFEMLTKCHPFHHDASNTPDWKLLQEFNVTPEGEEFLRKLLELNPGERSTPAQARDDEWLTAQVAKEQVRIVENELSRRSLASQTPPRKPKKRPRPLPAALSGGDAGAYCVGAKRKASVLGLGRTMSSLSVSDTDLKPPAKRARADSEENHDACSAETIRVPGLYRPTPPPRVVWTAETLDADEIPGLGRWRGSSNGPVT